jgi:hypothetical protein
MSPETLEELERRHGSLEEWMDVVPLQPGGTLLWRDGVSITGVEVAHSRGTLGYLIGTGTGRQPIARYGPLPDRTKNF